MKGVTLLETIVVIGIIAILSLAGVATINNFKRDASLDNAANELMSIVRVARSKSMNGEVLPGEMLNAENIFEENGYPEYGIEMKSDKYKIVRRFIKKGESEFTHEGVSEDYYLGSDYLLSPEDTFYFSRITGDCGSKIIKISEKNGARGREVIVFPDFRIEIKQI